MSITLIHLRNKYVQLPLLTSFYTEEIIATTSFVLLNTRNASRGWWWFRQIIIIISYIYIVQWSSINARSAQKEELRRSFRVVKSRPRRWRGAGDPGKINLQITIYPQILWIAHGMEKLNTGSLISSRPFVSIISSFPSHLALHVLWF